MASKSSAYITNEAKVIKNRVKSAQSKAVLRILDSDAKKLISMTDSPMVNPSVKKQARKQYSLINKAIKRRKKQVA